MTAKEAPPPVGHRIETTPTTVAPRRASQCPHMPRCAWCSASAWRECQAARGQPDGANSQAGEISIATYLLGKISMFVVLAGRGWSRSIATPFAPVSNRIGSLLSQFHASRARTTCSPCGSWTVQDPSRRRVPRQSTLRGRICLRLMAVRRASDARLGRTSSTDQRLLVINRVCRIQRAVVPDRLRLSGELLFARWGRRASV
jgi:hypothetical protein